LIRSREGNLKGVLVLLLLLSLCFPSVTSASESAYEINIARGIAAVEAGDHAGAIAEFREALELRPGDHTATLYLGIALSRAGDGEAEATLKRALLLNPEDARTNLELGIYYMDKSLYDEARDYFDNAMKLAPGTAISERAEGFRKSLTQRAKEKPWSLQLTLGGQYDSNVILNPDGSPLPEEISDESDWRVVGYLRGKVEILKGDSYQAALRYSLYQSVHTDLSDYNTTQHLPGLDIGFDLSPMFRFEAAYSFEYVHVGGDAYSYSHIAAPAFVISEGGGFLTTVRYQFRDNVYKDDELFEDNSDRTGSNHLLGITQNIPLHSRVLAQIGYEYDRITANEDFWEYRGNKATLALYVRLPHSILVNLKGEYYDRDFEDVWPGTGRERQDGMYTASIAISKELTDYLSLTVGQLYRVNNSNIESLDYERAITSLFLTLRF
jgi:hypothetical protein